MRKTSQTTGLQRVVECSLLSDRDLPAIRQAILDALGAVSSGEPHATLSQRHMQCVQNALKEMNNGILMLKECRGDSPTLVAVHLRLALEALGELTGKSYTAELLDRIFSRFCVGK